MDLCEAILKIKYNVHISAKMLALREIELNVKSNKPKTLNTL